MIIKCIWIDLSDFSNRQEAQLSCRKRGQPGYPAALSAAHFMETDISKKQTISQIQNALRQIIKLAQHFHLCLFFLTSWSFVSCAQKCCNWCL